MKTTSHPQPHFSNTRINIVGLGYVGLPLAVEFGKTYYTVGYDINITRIDELSRGHDRTQELTSQQIAESEFLIFTSKLSKPPKSNFRNIYIITVPTPIDEFKRPDLKPLLSASKSVALLLNQNDIVI